MAAFGAGGRPQVSKQPIAAWQDTEFARTARHLHGTTFVAHVRYASTGAHTVANTHPFLQDGRLFAHNGVVQGLPDLDRRLTELGTADLVHGETDSERVFALITGETRGHGGDLGRGITAAIGWIAGHLPVYAVNLVLATATDLWALRYPATHELYVLDARRAGPGPGPPWRCGPAGSTPAPRIWRPSPRSSSRANGWTTTRPGACSSRGNCCTPDPICASAAAHRFRPNPASYSRSPTSTPPRPPPSTPPDRDPIGACLPRRGSATEIYAFPGCLESARLVKPPIFRHSLISGQTRLMCAISIGYENISYK